MVFAEGILAPMLGAGVFSAALGGIAGAAAPKGRYALRAL